MPIFETKYNVGEMVYAPKLAPFGGTEDYAFGCVEGIFIDKEKQYYSILFNGEVEPRHRFEESMITEI